MLEDQQSTSSRKTIQRRMFGVLQVRMVGIKAANIRNNIEKKRKPVLLKTLLASFPILR